MQITDNGQSVISYLVGGGGIVVAEKIDVISQLAANAQDYTIIGGFIIVVLRVMYDALRLYRSIRNKNEQSD